MLADKTKFRLSRANFSELVARIKEAGESLDAKYASHALGEEFVDGLGFQFALKQNSQLVTTSPFGCHQFVVLRCG
jgi:hypothetical protein